MAVLRALRTALEAARSGRIARAICCEATTERERPARVRNSRRALF